MKGKKALNDTTKMANFIKNKDQFTQECFKNYMKIQTKSTKNNCYKQKSNSLAERVQNRVFELKGELKEYFQGNYRPEFAE